MALPFVNRVGGAVALIDAATSERITYDDLSARVAARADQFPVRTGVALLLCTNSVKTAIDYLAILRLGMAVIPLDAAMDQAALDGIVATYEPDLVLGATSADRAFGAYTRVAEDFDVHARVEALPALCDELAILLSTSGSTGNPRMVRLTNENIAANTRSIIASLSITADDRAITSMPLHYSYGLSVLNTHLAAGASVVVSDASIVDPAFWAQVKEHEVTTFAGVPYTFAMLTRLRYDPVSTPSVRKVTQAGGKLDLASTERFHQLFADASVGFYIMYGQTEAAPRIACLPADRLGDKLGSAGLPMLGGKVSIEVDGREASPGEPGEVVYSGPNVMLGYATNRAELDCRDELGGVLHTGDIGYLDDEGFLFITGRMKRITKLFGSRVSLDDVEAMLAGLGPVAAVGGGEERLHVHHQQPDDDAVTAARRSLSRSLKVPVVAIEMHRDADFPLMPNGKVDYRALGQRHEQASGS